MKSFLPCRLWSAYDLYVSTITGTCHATCRNLTGNAQVCTYGLTLAAAASVAADGCWQDPACLIAYPEQDTDGRGGVAINASAIAIVAALVVVAVFTSSLRMWRVRQIRTVLLPAPSLLSGCCTTPIRLSYNTRGGHEEQQRSFATADAMWRLPVCPIAQSLLSGRLSGSARSASCSASGIGRRSWKLSCSRLQQWNMRDRLSLLSCPTARCILVYHVLSSLGILMASLLRAL